MNIKKQYPVKIAGGSILSPSGEAQKQLQALYDELEQRNAQTLAVYPEIQCPTGCYTCCQTYGSPMTSSLEWDVVKQAFEALPPAQKKQIQAQYQALKQVLRNRLKQPDLSVSACLFDLPCPFLIQGKCSIYASRPLTCRAFGLMQSQDQSLPLQERIFACRSETERWEKALPLQGAPQLPLKEPFFQRLQALDPHPMVSLFSRFDREFQNASRSN